MTTMKRIFLLAAALLTAGAALAQSEHNERRRTLFEALPIRSNDIVFLGDGITEGCEWAELFDNRHVRNRGIAGDRSDRLTDRIDTLIAGHPKKLFLMIGINDLAAGLSPEEVSANIGWVIDRFRTESRWTRIFVQSILPVNGRSFALFPDHYAQAAGIVRTNRLLEALCTGKEIIYLDVYTPLVDSNGNLNAAYTNDGLHLTGAGYLVWRDAIKPYVK